MHSLPFFLSMLFFFFHLFLCFPFCWFTSFCFLSYYSSLLSFLLHFFRCCFLFLFTSPWVLPLFPFFFRSLLSICSFLVLFASFYVFFLFLFTSFLPMFSSEHLWVRVGKKEDDFLFLFGVASKSFFRAKHRASDIFEFTAMLNYSRVKRMRLTTLKKVFLAVCKN